MPRLLSVKYLFLPAIYLLITACHKPYYIQQHSQKQYVIDNNGRQDSTIIKMLQPYKRGVDTQMDVVIGTTDIPLTKAQPESTIGNFIADAQLIAALQINPKVDASVANYGGIRLSYLSPGPVTLGRIFELMPFENTLALVEVPGKNLHELCNRMAAAKGWPVKRNKIYY